MTKKLIYRAGCYDDLEQKYVWWSRHSRHELAAAVARQNYSNSMFAMLQDEPWSRSAFVLHPNGRVEEFCSGLSGFLDEGGVSPQLCRMLRDATRKLAKVKP